MREQAPARLVPDNDGPWSMWKHEQTTPTQAQQDLQQERLRNQANDLNYRYKIMHDDGIAGECVFPTIGVPAVYRGLVVDQLITPGPVACTVCASGRRAVDA